MTNAIERASGLKTEIITGAREADWAFRGVTTDPQLAKTPLLLLDVGGGSTEFILGHGVKKSFAHSFPLGTVRLMEKFPHSDPPATTEFNACRDWLKNFLHREVRPQLGPALKNEAVKSGSSAPAARRASSRAWKTSSTASTAKKLKTPF